MGVENGEWIMRGLAWDDPFRIRSWQELVNWIGEVGFLPLFANEIAGFSVEEHVSPAFWWTGDREQDPWEWREIIARGHRVAYGKFFNKKAGFISLAWLPYFANFRRDGYDFDSLYEEGMANARSKRVMDVFADGEGGWHDEPILSTELKRRAGFGVRGSAGGVGGAHRGADTQALACRRGGDPPRDREGRGALNIIFGQKNTRRIPQGDSVGYFASLEEGGAPRAAQVDFIFFLH